MTSPRAEEPSAPPLQVFIVEDEFHARSYLVELVHRSGRGTVVGAVGTKQEAMEALSLADGTPKIDVALVDVNLGGTRDREAGLELVRELLKKAATLRFVLATASPDHALTAYELGVLDYLTKPFTLERVDSCLRRVRDLLPASPAAGRAGPPSRLVARNGKRLVLLPFDEAFAFEAHERLVFVHTRLGRLDVDLSLTALEASCGGQMTRVHRNWLIRLSAVTGIEREGLDTTLFIDIAGRSIRVPVARERAPAIREQLLADSTGIRRG